MKSFVALVCILILFAVWNGFISMVMTNEITLMYGYDAVGLSSEQAKGNIDAFHQLLITWYFGPIVNIAGFLSAIIGVYFAVSESKFIRRLIMANLMYILVFMISSILCAIPVASVVMNGNFMKMLFAFVLFIAIMNATSFYWGRVKNKNE